MRRWIEIESNVEQLAVPDNRITLTDEVDALGMPKSQVHWSVSPEEERTYRRGVELVVEALDQQAPGLKDRKMEYPDPWPDTIEGCWHHMGTTRMNNDPNKGVVDSDCKVHDVDNLYVAGSSVFPTGGAGSPTLTIVALAFRLSDHLKARLAADASTV
jgi:choline dehydrogenase-like flavoprotein